MKKCPSCGSTKINENRRYLTCGKCGYILDKTNELIKQRIKNEKNIC